MANRQPTEEEAHEDTANILAEMDHYLTKYYGPRCPDYEKGCVVCDVWKLFDDLQRIIA